MEFSFILAAISEEAEFRASPANSSVWKILDTSLLRLLGPAGSPFCRKLIADRLLWKPDMSPVAKVCREHREGRSAHARVVSQPWCMSNRAPCNYVLSRRRRDLERLHVYGAKQGEGRAAKAVIRAARLQASKGHSEGIYIMNPNGSWTKDGNVEVAEGESGYITAESRTQP